MVDSGMHQMVRTSGLKAFYSQARDRPNFSNLQQKKLDKVKSPYIFI
jgi:hypothetical protein